MIRCGKCRQCDILMVRSQYILTDLLYLTSRRIRAVFVRIVFPQAVQQDPDRCHNRRCIQTFHIIINVIHRFFCLRGELRMLLLYIAVKDSRDPPYILFDIKERPFSIVTMLKITGPKDQFCRLTLLSCIQKMVHFFFNSMRHRFSYGLTAFLLRTCQNTMTVCKRPCHQNGNHISVHTSNVVQ